MIDQIAALIASVFIVSASSGDAPYSPPRPAMTHTDAVMKVLAPLVAKWEGLRTTAYQDIVGVWTVCYGETKGVRPGDSYSVAECEAMLRRELLEYHAALLPAFTADTRRTRLPPPRHAAFDSLSYNVGTAGTAKSTAVRRLNAGDVPGACEAIGWWNKAGGRVVRGLVNRRAEETALCMEGV